MHNVRLADPLDPIARQLKRVSSHRNKTDEQHEEMARLEHMGGLYMDPVIGPFIPGQNIERCLVEAARITRAGKKIERGVFIETDVNPLSYDGPRDVDGLWKDARFRHRAAVGVTTNRVMRTRPLFMSWRVEAEGSFDPDVISIEEFSDIAATAGLMIGLGDYRPRFGRFAGTVEEVAA